VIHHVLIQHVPTFVHRDTSLVNIAEDPYVLIDELSEQFKAYRRGGTRLKRLVFKETSDAIPPTQVVDVLVGSSLVNSLFFEYEKWHDSATRKLCEVQSIDAAAGLKARALLNCISSFHSNITREIITASEQQTRVSDTQQGFSQLNSHVRLENEVKIHVGGYKFPAILIFKCRCESLQSHISFCGMSESLYPDIGLDEQDDRNKLTILHLQWIDKILGQLNTPHDCHLINDSRQTEILAGLTEHRNNVITHIEAARFINIHPNDSVQTIITSEINALASIHALTVKIDRFRPTLLFPPAMVMVATLILSLKYLFQVPREPVIAFLELMRRSIPNYGLASGNIRSIAQDPRTYEKIIGLKVQEEHRALCPGCGSSYPIQANGLPKALHCERRGTQDSIACGKDLCYKRGERMRPLLLFRRRLFGDWLKGLLSRPGMVDKMEAAWEELKRPPSEIVTDIWGGSFVRSMKGPDNISPVSSIPKKEIRILLSVAVDWFNPYHNKVSGKNASTGVIFMTCLNLPPPERHKDENIYLVGILPGRKQQANLDGILTPLVKDLLRYWETGVYFIGLPGISEPRLVRCALVQLICDLPAARKIAGFPGHNATCHCSVCFSPRQKIADTSSAFDPKLRRTLVDHMYRARSYKSLLDSKDRSAAEALLKVDPRAVRWSPLNELPYWNPIQCTVLDSMHLVLLGLCQHHWRRVWGGDHISGHFIRSIATDPQSTDISKGLNSFAQPTSFTRFFHASNESSSHPDRRQEPKGETEEGQDDSKEGDPEPSDDLSFRTLDAKKMNEARVVWIMRSSEAFCNLNISQLLCLLKENGAKLPKSFTKKEDLAYLLEVCLGLPKHTYRKLTML
jgi:hypothetical protein